MTGGSASNLPSAPFALTFYFSHKHSARPDRNDQSCLDTPQVFPNESEITLLLHGDFSGLKRGFLPPEVAVLGFQMMPSPKTRERRK